MTIEDRTEQLSPEAARVYRAAKAINAMSDDMDAELMSRRESAWWTRYACWRAKRRCGRWRPPSRWV